MKCYLCGCLEHSRRPGKVRDDHNINILECQSCGLVSLSQSSKPENFYEKSGMHDGEPTPIPYWMKDTERDDERRFQYLSELMTNRDLLDFGSGTGGFLLKARNKAHQVIGIEPESRLLPHYASNDILVFRGLDELPQEYQFDIITAFHVLEHLEDPANTLAKLAKSLRNGKIIIEVPSSDDALFTLYESIPFSEFTYWSCHLYLFNSKNLCLLAKKAGLKLEYIHHIQRYPLSNHLYWLAKGKPGGHRIWHFIDSDDINRSYEARLAALGKTDTLIASLSL